MIRLAGLLVASSCAQALCLKLRELDLLKLALQVRDIGIALQAEIDAHIKGRADAIAIVADAIAAEELVS